MNKVRKGQAIVEMALLFPFFLLIILGGIIDFGLAFYNSVALQEIAHASAGWAAERNIVDAGIIANHASSLKPSWWTGAFRVQAEEVKTATSATPNVIKVTLSYESPAYTPFYQTMLGATTGTDHLQLRCSAAYQKATSNVVRP